MRKRFIVFAGISGAIAVVFGALGTHFLEDIITKFELETFETAVRYQMYHTFAILFTVLLKLKLYHYFLYFSPIYCSIVTCFGINYWTNSY